MRISVQLPAKPGGRLRVVSPHGLSFRATPLVRGEPIQRSSSSLSQSDWASSPAPAAANMPATRGPESWQAVGSLRSMPSLRAARRVLNENRRAGLRGSHVVALGHAPFRILIRAPFGRKVGENIVVIREGPTTPNRMSGVTA
jgi:hypothetical protein